MSEWKKYKLGELAEITSSKRIFYSDYVLEGIPFFRSKEIIEKSLGEYSGEPLFISRDKYFEIKEQYGAPLNGDLLISAVGERAGIPYLVKNQGDFYFKDGNLIWLKNIKVNLISNFLNYWIKSKDGQQTLENIMIGSAQKALTIIGLKNLEINLPSIQYQELVVELLSSLDDKIELLQRQNKTLEQLAETLFRQWFVEEAEDDHVKLGDVVKTSSGGTPSRSKMEYYSNGIIRWVKSKELQGSFIFETEETVTDEAVKNSSAKLFPANTILIAMYGATVGEYAILAEPATCNQAICALIHPYTFLFILTKFNKENLINMAGGSAQQNISQELIQKLAIPKSFVKIKKFHKETDSMFQKIKSNTIQIRTLKQLRDTLLPKLMSGEVRVKI